MARPWILGIAHSHNGSVCLLHGDEIVVAAQEERLLRVKRANLAAAQQSLALRYCLEYARLRPRDLNAVVTCPLIESTDLEGRTWDVAFNRYLEVTRHDVPCFRISHHVGHAIGAFAVSGFPDAGVLVVDGSGSRWDEVCEAERRVALGMAPDDAARPTLPMREHMSLYHACGTRLLPLEKHFRRLPDARQLADRASGMRDFNSLGHLYQAVGGQIFGSEAEGPGKVMGLAPYGSPGIPVKDFYRIVDGEFQFADTVPRRFRHHERWPSGRRQYANLAASAQRAIEEGVLYLARRVRELTHSKRLCYAGGVALNSVANERIIRRAGFDDVFILPAAEDCGTAIGAAYYGLWQLTGVNSRRRVVHDALGRQYSRAERDAAVAAHPGLLVLPCPDLVAKTVDLLCDGKIIGWFRGRSELGPRALGQRSILCDPRDVTMKRILNERVKLREEFRPFAPVVLHEQARAWFRYGTTHTDSPFMLRVLAFREAVRSRVPAVVHHDGTGRVQTITREANGPLYDVVAEFHRRTGVPMLLNTSFNIAGEPIVEAPEDALWALLLTGLDCCVFEDRVIGKRPGFDVLDLRIRIRASRIAINASRKAAPTYAQRELPEVEVFHARAASGQPSFAESSLRSVPHAVFQVPTKWGAAIYFTNPEIARVLETTGPACTGHELLQALVAFGYPGVDRMRLVRWLGVLRRLNIISMDEIQRI